MDSAKLLDELLARFERAYKDAVRKVGPSDRLRRLLRDSTAELIRIARGETAMLNGDEKGFDRRKA